MHAVIVPPAAMTRAASAGQLATCLVVSGKAAGRLAQSALCSVQFKTARVQYPHSALVLGS